MNSERPALLSVHDLLPVAGLASAWLWIRHWLPRLPERVPAHWDASGRVDGWMDKHQLFLPPLLLAGLAWALLFLLGLAFRSGDDRRQASAEALGILRGWLACGLALLAGYIGPMGAVQGGRAVVIGLGLLLACVVTGTVLVLRRIRRIPPIPGATEADYRWGGLIYRNPRDPRLLVPKRYGVGWTFNYGRPAAWILTALLLLLPLVALLLPRLLAR
ncbi:MAG TPA: DUF5808 domain-containing protein [Holophagaceae bacterium]|nr:DUF5808 domain-containing protein [Holophagaceae bacterium]